MPTQQRNSGSPSAGKGAERAVTPPAPPSESGQPAPSARTTSMIVAGGSLGGRSAGTYEVRGAAPAPGATEQTIVIVPINRDEPTTDDSG